MDNDIRLYGHPAELSGTLSDPGYRQFVGFDTRTLIPCIYEASACPVAEFGDAFELAEQASTAATDALVEGLERQVEGLRRVLARADRGRKGSEATLVRWERSGSHAGPRSALTHARPRQG